MTNTIKFAGHEFNPWTIRSNEFLRRSESYWRKAVRWNKDAKIRHDAWEMFKKTQPGLSDADLIAQGFAKPETPRILCGSLVDVFEDDVPFEWLMDLFELIAETPYLQWMIITKHIDSARKMCNDYIGSIGDVMAQRVWLGVTIENQEQADRDIPMFLSVPAAKRFLIATMIGHIDLTATPAGDIMCRCDGCIYMTPDSRLDWVIVSGKSDPMHPDHVRSLRDQCRASDVPFFFDGWGNWHTNCIYLDTDKPAFREFITLSECVDKSQWINGGICMDRSGRILKNGGDFKRANDEGKFPVTIMHKVGRKEAGRLLDGVEWNQIPGEL